MLVLLYGVQDLDNAVAIAEKIRLAIEAPFPSDAGQINITISIGATLAQRDEPIDAIIARADMAMFEAKREGRNQVIQSPPPPPPPSAPEQRIHA